MSSRLLTVAEAARFLRLNQRSLYLLVQRGAIPATRVTGKWLFPEHLLQEWLDSSALRHGRANPGGPGPRGADRVFVAGSDDPALDLLGDLLGGAPAGPLMFAAKVGSMAGLRAVALGRADLACVHLVDPDSGEYNASGVVRHLEGRPAALVNLFHRELGLLLPPGNPAGLGGLADLARPGLRLVNRQRGSGTRHFLDLGLTRAGVDPGGLAGYGDEVTTHLAVGLRVLRGEADLGLGARSVAHALGLAFVPLTRERFDMVVPKDVFFRPAVQTLLEAVRSDPFRRTLERLGGYEAERSGRVLAEVS